MKQSIFSLTFIALLAITIQSCKQDIEPIQSNISPENTILQKLNRVNGTKGGLMIASKSSFYKTRKSPPTFYQIDGGFDGLPFEKILIDGFITLEPFQKIDPSVYSNQYITTQDYTVKQISELFGKKVSIGYISKSNNIDLRTETSIQTPNELNLILPDGDPGGGGGSNFYRNVPLSWNAGNSNDEVYVLMSFEPQSISNAEFRNYSRVDKFYSVADNGSYTLSESNFQGIPQGAYVTIVVARGTTALSAGVANGSQNTSITALALATVVGQVGGGGGGTGGGDTGIYIY